MLASMCRGVSAFDSLNTKQWQKVLMAMQKRHCFAGEVVVAQVSAVATANLHTQDCDCAGAFAVLIPCTCIIMLAVHVMVP